MRRLLGPVALVLFVSAASCDESGDDDSAPTGGTAGAPAAGFAGAMVHGGTAGTTSSASGRGGLGGHSGNGAGGSPAGQSGMAGEGGGLDVECVASMCAAKALVGPCPPQAPDYYDPCSNLGATCAYCGDSESCPGETEGFILQCCADGTWQSDCYDDCVDSIGAGGQGGAGGQSGEGGQAGAAAAGATCDALLSMCCSTDDACPSGFECATAPDGGPSHGFAGVCKARPPTNGQCWKDADCPAGYSCFDALYCGCGQGCQDEALGICFR